MVAAQIEQVRGGDFLWIDDQWRAAERGLWRGNGGFKQRAITQSFAATMRGQYFAVDGEDRRDIEMNQ